MAWMLIGVAVGVYGLLAWDCWQAWRRFRR